MLMPRSGNAASTIVQCRHQADALAENRMSCRRQRCSRNRCRAFSARSSHAHVSRRYHRYDNRASSRETPRSGRRWWDAHRSPRCQRRLQRRPVTTQWCSPDRHGSAAACARRCGIVAQVGGVELLGNAAVRKQFRRPCWLRAKQTGVVEIDRRGDDRTAHNNLRTARRMDRISSLGRFSNRRPYGIADRIWPGCERALSLPERAQAARAASSAGSSHRRPPRAPRRARSDYQPRQSRP